MMEKERDTALAKKGRLVGLVIAFTMVLWLVANFAGPAMGVPLRFALLVDFAALAAFFWAMVVIYQMWQARQSEKKD
ncbi:MAG: DUF5337 domain-containing protein [Sulfitobacter sp.]